MLTRKEMIGPWAGLPVAWDENMMFDESGYRADVHLGSPAAGGIRGGDGCRCNPAGGALLDGSG